MRIYPLIYNKYANRKARYNATLAEYIPFAARVTGSYYSVNNFNPANGLDTTQVMDTEEFPISGLPDYCIVTDDSGANLSRWYVVGCDDIRNGKIKMHLTRDTVADAYDDVISCTTTYIERAVPKSTATNDTVSVRDEGISFNQKLVSRTLIQNPITYNTDISKPWNQPWIVVYVAKWEDESDPHTTLKLPGGGYDWTAFETVATANCPYRILVIPPAGYPIKIGTSLYNTESGTQYNYSNEDLSPLGIAGAISELNSSDKIIDVQYLPYPPIFHNLNYSGSDPSEQVDDTMTFTFSNVQITNNEDSQIPAGSTSTRKQLTLGTVHSNCYQIICHTTADANKNKIPIIACGSDRFNAKVQFTYTLATDLLSRKIDANVGKLRICSPNHSNFYDFNVAMNCVGSATITKQLYLRGTCKPGAPFIQVQPVYNSTGLYGSNNALLEDRALICTGDFSLPRSSNSWENYISQNKNYAAVFFNSLNLQEQQSTQALNQGLLSSAMDAAQTGGLLAKVAGPEVGVIAGIASAGLGVADYFVNRQKMEDSIAVSKANFYANNASIKARPNAVTNVGSLTNINAPGVYVEEYKCTADEETAFRAYLTAKGYRVDRIGTISDYQTNPSDPQHFTRAMLYRFEPSGSIQYYTSDYVNRLQAELKEGVYM